MRRCTVGDAGHQPVPPPSSSGHQAASAAKASFISYSRGYPSDGGDFSYYAPPDAPVFVPTEEEFAEGPIRYVASIRAKAEPFGICRIIPPRSFRPPFALDMHEFSFTPRVQRLNEIEALTRVKINFLEQVIKFWDLQVSPACLVHSDCYSIPFSLFHPIPSLSSNRDAIRCLVMMMTQIVLTLFALSPRHPLVHQGTTLKIPLLDKRALDLHHLHTSVQAEGGFETCTRDKKWSRVAHRMVCSAEVTFHSTIMLTPCSSRATHDCTRDQRRPCCDSITSVYCFRTTSFCREQRSLLIQRKRRRHPLCHRFHQRNQ